MTLFAGTLLLDAAFLPSIARRPAGDPGRDAELARIGVWARWIATPALLLVWLFGALLAHQAGWFGAHWLDAKLALVVVLTGLHLAHLRAIGRLRAGQRVRLSYGGLALAAVMLAVILVLVTAKPG